MRYVANDDPFQVGDDCLIRAADGTERYFVDAKATEIIDRISFQDAHGNELAMVAPKLLATRPTYEVHRDGRVAATIVRELFAYFRPRFVVDAPGPDEFYAEGDFNGREYAFLRDDGKTLATVSTAAADDEGTYAIDVGDAEDQVLLLLCVVVVDMVSQLD